MSSVSPPRRGEAGAVGAGGQRRRAAGTAIGLPIWRKVEIGLAGPGTLQILSHALELGPDNARSDRRRESAVPTAKGRVHVETQYSSAAARPCGVARTSGRGCRAPWLGLDGRS